MNMGKLGMDLLTRVSKKAFVCVVCVLIFGGAIAYAEVQERSEVPEQYKWDLTALYPSFDTWRTHKAELAERVENIGKYQGVLGKDADTMLEALTEYAELDKQINRLYGYASMLSDQDIRISENQEYVQEAENLWVIFDENSSYIIPELIKLDPKLIEQYQQAKPEMEEFSMFLADIQRQREHTLSEAEEKILASAGSITEAPETIYDIFDNAEMPRPEVTFSDGETVELEYTNYLTYRASDVREDRQKAMQAFFEQYGKFKDTFGANLVAALKNHNFYAKTRKYDSCLEAALDDDNIPVSLYENLITQIHNSLPTLHRFLDLKKRMLGVDELHYYDLYASIVKDVDLEYTVEEGQEILLAALQPLGATYTDTLKQSFENHWIDYLPNQGKWSGGYSSGPGYDVHPYILMNWIDDYDSLSTLAHEGGHALHTFYSNQAQPYAKADYSIFVAEIASTLNENLLIEHLIAQTEDKNVKLSLLGTYLENLRTTIFRQVLFAEYEWEIHKKIENGEPLSGESLSELYYDLVKTYYGHDDGICFVEPEIAYEWAYISHFYYNFYVYQYATSLIYATALTEKIREEGQPAIDRYFNLLRGGGSKYPTEIVLDAGIDPFSSQPFELTMKLMNNIMDQIDAIIAEQ